MYGGQFFLSSSCRTCCGKLSIDAWTAARETARSKHFGARHCAQTICFAFNVKIMDQRSSISSKPNPESINCLMVDISRLDGFEKPIKLPCNDSAFWMSPRAIEAGLNSLERSHLYPEVNTDRLAAAIEAVIS